jgi:HK97 family phage major capsid protein
MHKSTLVKIQTLRDEIGRFLWSPKLNHTMPETLLGYRVLCSEYMPQYSDESKGEAVVLFGDFKSAYKIIDHREIPIMRDPYSNRPFVGFYAVKRVGGDLINPDALVALTYPEA